MDISSYEDTVLPLTTLSSTGQLNWQCYILWKHLLHILHRSNTQNASKKQVMNRSVGVIFRAFSLLLCYNSTSIGVKLSPNHAQAHTVLHCVNSKSNSVVLIFRTTISHRNFTGKIF